MTPHLGEFAAFRQRPRAGGRSILIRAVSAARCAIVILPTGISRGVPATAQAPEREKLA
ncbi:hypothetical protein ACW73L_10620 [Methylolobus aquaticus]